jgi:hypothetical protein
MRNGFRLVENQNGLGLEAGESGGEEIGVERGGELVQRLPAGKRRKLKKGAEMGRRRTGLIPVRHRQGEDTEGREVEQTHSYVSLTLKTFHGREIREF